MDFRALSFIFNRALALAFSKKKGLLVFSLLALSGLLVVFFKGLAMHAGHWVQLSLTFLPIFICTGILLSMGVLLIRLYHNEVKRKEQSYGQTLSHSWVVLMGASYFTVPIMLGYLLLWIMLGLFVLLSDIPVVGAFFGAVLAFAPFLINLGTLVLCLASVALLFFVAPAIAFKGLEGASIMHLTLQRLEKDPFANLILLMIALLPLTGTALLLILAAWLTGSVEGQNTVQTVIRWFFIMLPFTACLTPAVIFFFNFAAEAHVLLQKPFKENS